MMPILVLVQYCLGVYIYKAYEPERKGRPARNQVHRITGPVIILIGFADCVLGFVRWEVILPEEGRAAWISFWVFLGTTLITYGTLVVIGERLKARFEKGSKAGFETTWKTVAVGPEVGEKGQLTESMDTGLKGVTDNGTLRSVAVEEQGVDWADATRTLTRKEHQTSV
jgi:hypothetical protein